MISCNHKKLGFSCKLFLRSEDLHLFLLSNGQGEVSLSTIFWLAELRALFAIQNKSHKYDRAGYYFLWSGFHSKRKRGACVVIRTAQGQNFLMCRCIIYPCKTYHCRTEDPSLVLSVEGVTFGHGFGCGNVHNGRCDNSGLGRQHAILSLAFHLGWWVGCQTQY